MSLWLSEQGSNKAGLGNPVQATIASGVLAAPGGAQNLVVNAESATSDDLTQITGIGVGRLISISPASGDTITVVNGANMALARSNNIMADVDDNMLLEVTAAGVCREIDRTRHV